MIAAPQMSSATHFFLMAPEAYATPIEAAAPLAPIFIANNNAAQNARAIMFSFLLYRLLMKSAFCFTCT
ncbi:hypothetical protein D3C84_1070680 [compost metagenome]